MYEIDVNWARTRAFNAIGTKLQKSGAFEENLRIMDNIFKEIEIEAKKGTFSLYYRFSDKEMSKVNQEYVAAFLILRGFTHEFHFDYYIGVLFLTIKWN